MTLELPEDLEKRLEKVAKKLNVTKQYCIEQAILAYIEDQEDIFAAEKVIAEDDGTSYTLKEVYDELKLNSDENS